MSAPNLRRQKESRGIVDRLFRDASNVWVIHYSCESFYDSTDGRSPRITSIALRRLHSGQTVSFSIHQRAEIDQIVPNEIIDHYDQLEKKMLSDFFEHIGGHKGMHYLHWNMRDINYGFAAIEHRYEVLGGEPYVVPDDHKHDLSRLLLDVYGIGYIGHPRLLKLLERNQIAPRDFMSGAEEAAAFDEGNYVGLHQSTLRKVDVIANIAGRVNDRHLEVNTSWWDMNGGRLRDVLNWILEHTWLKVLLAAAGIIGLAATIGSIVLG